MASPRNACVVLALVAAIAAAPSVALSDPVTVVVTRQDCARLVRHRPDADVAYRPGVDVYGRAVAPADLGGGLKIELPEVFTFNVLIQPIDFARRRAIAAERARLAGIIADDPSQAPDLADDLAALDREEALIEQRGLSETTMAVGRVVVQADGTASFNGQPLQSEEESALAALCQRRLQSGEN